MKNHTAGLLIRIFASALGLTLWLFLGGCASADVPTAGVVQAQVSEAITVQFLPSSGGQAVLALIGRLAVLPDAGKGPGASETDQAIYSAAPVAESLKRIRPMVMAPSMVSGMLGNNPWMNISTPGEREIVLRDALLKTGADGVLYATWPQSKAIHNGMISFVPPAMEYKFEVGVYSSSGIIWKQLVTVTVRLSENDWINRDRIRRDFAVALVKHMFPTDSIPHALSGLQAQP